MPQARSSNHTSDPESGVVRIILLIALFILIFGALTVANYRLQQQSSGGSDMIPRWLGTRLFLLEGINPYSDKGTEAIQLFYYGHPARPDQDQVLFVYPLYTIYLFAPFSLIENFPLARALYMTVMEMSLFLLTFISLKLARWRLPALPLAGLLIFATLWYHSVRPLINGNAAIFSALFIALALLAIREERSFVGGFLLAFSSIKPQMVILLIPLVLLWAVSSRRWSLIIGVLGSFALLILSTIVFEPTWPIDNLRQMLAYPGYTLPGTPAEIFSEWWPAIDRVIGWLFTVIMSIILLWSWRLTWAATFDTLWWAVCMTLALTNLIGIRTTTANYIALLPGLILVLAEWQGRWPRSGRWYGLLVLLILFVGLWYLFLSTRSGRMQNPILFFPLPIFLIVALMTIIPTRSSLEKNRSSPAELSSPT